MPVVAIGAAVVAGIGAASAVGAVVSGGLAALTLTGAFEIAAALGATLGAVGVVTKDKSLQMAGLVIGGIGGVGALASSAGLFGAEASTASLFGSGDAAAAGAFPESIAVTPQIAGSGVGASGASTGIVDSFGAVDAAKALPTAGIEQQTGAAAGSVADTAAATPVGLTPPAAPSSTALLQQPQPVSVAPNAALTPAAPAAPAAPSSFAESLQQAGAGQPLGPVPMEPPGMFSGIGDFMSKNPYASYGLIQAGGSLVSGLFNPVTQAQVEALNAQAAQNRAATGITSAQAANMAQAIPVASRAVPAGVTGSTGLINSRPPAAVTGAPA